jgi:YD repeat-containing protein
MIGVSSLVSQELPSQINVIPPSPNVMAMNKYVDVPVGHYTGTPNVNVPIFELKMQQLSLPISLNYHASGLKVEEQASWVGAGWVLSAGGNINRTIRGLPDEYLPVGSTTLPGRKGYFFNHKMFTSSNLLDVNDLVCDNTVSYPTNGEPLSTLDSLVQGYLDTEPDLYSFSFPGGAGKFVFSRDQEIVRVVSDDIKITEHPFDGTTVPHLGASAATSDYEWTIKGADGIIYTFKHAERTNTSGGCGFALSFYDDPVLYAESTWHLDRMSIGGEWIQFHYVDETITYDMRVTSSERFKVAGISSSGGSVTACTNGQTVSAKRLDKITTSNGYEVKFIATVDRTDLNGGKRLEKIEVLKDDNLIKAYNLAYSYFNTNTKLKLESVKQTDGSTELPGYEFDYVTGNIPAITSNSQDFWGYYNQATNTGGLIPKYKTSSVYVDGGANRTPSLSRTKIGTLEKINYPTGGYSEFTYELHDYYETDIDKTIILEAKAENGTNGSPVTDSETFTLTSTTSATLTIVGDLTLYSTSQFRKHNGSSYQPYTPTLIPQGNRYSLPAGDYQLFAQNGDGGTNSVTIEFEKDEDFEETAGGLRVSEIKTYDPATAKSLIKKFEYTQENGNSSGVLFTPPILGSAVVKHTGGSGAGAQCGPNGEVAYFVTVNSANQLPSAIYHGSHIGYSRVTESQVDPANPLEDYENGKMVYEFINDKGVANFAFPLVTQQDISFKNGKLLKETMYKNDGQNLLKVSETVNVYAQSTGTTSVTGYKVTQVETKDCYECIASEYGYNQYTNTSTWHYLESTTQTNYDDLQRTVTVETEYDYLTGSTPSHYLPVSNTTLDSKGEELLVSYSRHSSNPALITEMVKSRDGEVISTQSFTYYGKLPQTISKTEIDFNTQDQNFPETYPLVGYTFSTESTVLQAYTFPRSSPGGTDKGVVTSFIWGYNNAHPIAQVINAKRDEVAFTSFEADHTGNWDYSGTTVEDVNSPTGKHYYTLGSGDIEIDGLSADQTFIVSYWVKDGTPSVAGSPNAQITSRNAIYTDAQGWSYYEKVISGVTDITISGSAKMDELRLYPQRAQMTTYTYDPGVGRLSETTANGVTTRYAYDSFNRLSKIMDRDGNTIKLFTYTYQQAISN